MNAIKRILILSRLNCHRSLAILLFALFGPDNGGYSIAFASRPDPLVSGSFSALWLGNQNCVAQHELALSFDVPGYPDDGKVEIKPITQPAGDNLPTITTYLNNFGVPVIYVYPYSLSKPGNYDFTITATATNGNNITSSAKDAKFTITGGPCQDEIGLKQPTGPFFVGDDLNVTLTPNWGSGKSLIQFESQNYAAPSGSRLTQSVPTELSCDGPSNSTIGPCELGIADLPGTYSWWIYPFDTNGNEGNPVYVTFNVSSSGAPVIIASVGSGPFTIGSPVTISYSAGAPSGDSVATVQASVVSEPQGSAIGGQSPSPSGTSFTVNPDQNGIYTFSLTATDVNGVVSSPVQVSFEVGAATFSPIIQSLSATPATLLVNQGSVNVSAVVAAGNASFPLTGDTWTITSPSGGVQTSSASAPFTNPSTSFVPMSSGTWQVLLTAIAQTNLQKTSSTSINAIAVNGISVTPVSIPPGNVATLTLGTTGGNPSSLNVVWSIVDQDGNVPANSVVQTSGNPIQGTWMPTCPGTYLVTATVTDSIGGSASVSTTVASFAPSIEATFGTNSEPGKDLANFPRIRSSAVRF